MTVPVFLPSFWSIYNYQCNVEIVSDFTHTMGVDRVRQCLQVLHGFIVDVDLAHRGFVELLAGFLQRRVDVDVAQ